MKTSVLLLVMSILSDVQEMLCSGDTPAQNNRVNFAKWMLHKYNDTQTEIDSDEEWGLFASRITKRKQ